MGNDFIVRPVKHPSFDKKKAAKQKELEDEFDKEFQKMKIKKSGNFSFKKCMSRRGSL